MNFIEKKKLAKVLQMAFSYTEKVNDTNWVSMHCLLCILIWYIFSPMTSMTTILTVINKQLLTHHAPTQEERAYTQPSWCSTVPYKATTLGIIRNVQICVLAKLLPNCRCYCIIWCNIIQNNFLFFPLL